jgi:lipopolysaccharide biosynthesis protein
MGVVLGERLMPPAKGNNEKGFWEDIDFVALNAEMLEIIGRSWHSLDPIQAIDVDNLCDRGYLSRATDLLHSKINGFEYFSLKDPRTAVLLPFWEKVFITGDFDVRYILAIRNPVSVANSLARRDSFDPEKSFLLWAEHMVSGLANVGMRPFILLDYDQLMSDPEGQLHRLASWLGTPLDSEKLAVYCNDFLDEKLRHSKFSNVDVQANEAVSPLVREIYSVLVEVSNERMSIEELRTSDYIQRWKEEIERVRPILQWCDKLSNQIIKVKTELSAQKILLLERNEFIENCEEKILALTQSVAERDKKISDLTQCAIERENQISALTQSAIERENQISALTQSAIERDEKISKLSMAPEDLNTEISALQKTISALYASKSWQLTAPLRYMLGVSQKMRHTAKLVPVIIERNGGFNATIRLSIKVIKNEGVGGFFRQTLKAFEPPQSGLSSVGTINGLNRSISIEPFYIDPGSERKPPAYLDAPEIGIHLHVFYVDLLDEMISYLANVKFHYDLFVSVQENVDRNDVELILRRNLSFARDISVEAVPNRGRDIAPFIIQFGTRLAKYEIVGHFHTKKSTHNSNLSSWRTKLFDNLFGTPESSGGRVAKIIEKLLTSAKIVFPEGDFGILKDSTGWADNYDIAKRFLQKYTELRIEDYPVIDFPEGFMFWARGACIKDFLDLPLAWGDFPREPIKPDGTLAHALERLLFVFANAYPGKFMRLHEGDSIHDFLHYEDQRDYSSLKKNKDIKILSYYLPQFHPTPENDLWHGEGFTEWTKVRASNPLFAGHYQQHIPHPDLGYYLIDGPDILQKQAEMMYKAGVAGQIFYHYWFSGKLILENPAQILLANPDIDMPFCFCWANENWTRRWDGNEKEILLQQNYSSEDAKDFIHYLLPFFKDPRYIRIDNRPVLFVYRPSSIVDSQMYQRIWEEECQTAGIDKPYIVAVLTRGATNPHDFAMDAGVERVLHDWTNGAVSDIKNQLTQYESVNGSVLPYHDVAEFYSRQVEEKPFTYFRSLVPMWDNTARYGREAFLLHGSTPACFAQWLNRAIDYSKNTLPEDRRFIIVNAWNEWAEGAHLEPDSRYGFSYLNSVGRALSGISLSQELNVDAEIPRNLVLHITIPESIASQFKIDKHLKSRFFRCLTASTIFKICKISFDREDFIDECPCACVGDSGRADFIIEFRRAVFFGADVLEKMLKTALSCPSSVVLANTYGDRIKVPNLTENGSTSSEYAYHAAIGVLSKKCKLIGYKNFRVRTDAHCFVTNVSSLKDGPIVTTVIRFHKSGDIQLLSNALYCLAAMQGCRVTPLVVTQDLSEFQSIQLEKLLNCIPWANGVNPTVLPFFSENGKDDLRSTLLNEGLRAVKTRYAAFLDYDDLLFSTAYQWLLSRLIETGKAVSFGRVYATSYRYAEGVIVKRERTYEYGYSYDEFEKLNHAPLHSFMLDLSKIDRQKISYNKNQKFMEDYYMTLQVFTKENSDWEGLGVNKYIGDYMHSVDRGHTLAFVDNLDRMELLNSEEYKCCEHWIFEMRTKLKSLRA